MIRINILFMCLGEFADMSSGSVHIDCVKELNKHGTVYLVCKSERNKNGKTGPAVEEGVQILRVATGSIKTDNMIRKGISTLTVESQFKKAIREHFRDVHFDLVIYTTPPITFVNPIKYVKKRDGAKTYLMLKDIFPQNAVDIGVMGKSGITAPLYWYFRRKEKALYRISDRIGCMSPANIDFIRKNNPEIPAEKLEIFPNSVYVRDMSISDGERTAIREKHRIPLDRKVFVYGGNLGKPQGIPFMLECMKQVTAPDAYFLIVGNGTEYGWIESALAALPKEKAENIRLMKGLPKAEYDTLVAACDAGMIFLDHRFTIPNFPSRILSYMQARLPVITVTDPNTDIGRIAEAGGFGWRCESGRAEEFAEAVGKALQADLSAMGDRGFEYLKEHYDVEKNCEALMKTF